MNQVVLLSVSVGVMLRKDAVILLLSGYQIQAVYERLSVPLFQNILSHSDSESVLGSSALHLMSRKPNEKH